MNEKDLSKSSLSSTKSKSLHPSWEARKMQKEMLKIDLDNVQNTKIRFD